MIPAEHTAGNSERSAARFTRTKSRDRWLVILLVTITSVIATASLSLHRGLPLPAVHDEFSYLLAADTFAHGRITNAPHAMWEHFESMHILVQPTYMSKYPPAQGLVMAAAQVLGVAPIWGVWVVTAIASGAICWMLMGFVPLRWTFLGALLVAVHPQILSWGQQYWGGNVAVLGGALLLGGLTRLTRYHTAGRAAAVCMAVGMLILANSRPYEGLVLTSLLLLELLLGTMRRKYPSLQLPVRSVAIPVLTILLPGGLLMALYNLRITKDVLRMPQIEHEAQYGVVPIFIFLPAPQPPTYRHKELELFHARWERSWQKRRDAWNHVKDYFSTNISLYEGSMGLAGTALLAFPFLLRKDLRLRFLLIVLLLFTGGLLLETFFFPHYSAPGTALVAAIVTVALRHLARKGRATGAIAVVSLVAVYLFSSLWWWCNFLLTEQQGFAAWRQQVAAELARQPGQHLVIVRYNNGHDFHQEWVYNEADIDSAKIVWAREMDRERNRRLLNYFSERSAWLLEPNVNPTTVRPYAQ